MADTNWFKQAKDKALFEDLLWSRPENKQLAGKLLIIGGNAHGFKAPATCYNQAIKAGVGSLKVLLPENLRKTVGSFIEAGYYAPANKSGSFSRQALAEFLDYAANVDLVLLSGDFGHNSETSIFLETLITKYTGPLVLSGDSSDSFLASPLALINRPQTLVVGDVAKLQKLNQKARSLKPVVSSANLMQLVNSLLDQDSLVGYLTMHQGNYLVSANKKVSTTPLARDNRSWEYDLAAYAAVWWLQNMTKVFEALTTAVYDYNVNEPANI